MDEPWKSEYFPEWPHWARWVGLWISLSALLLGLIAWQSGEEPLYSKILAFLGVSLGLVLGSVSSAWHYRFRRGWRVDVEGVHEVLLTGRTGTDGGFPEPQ